METLVRNIGSQLPIEHTVKNYQTGQMPRLIESSLGDGSFCWFRHEVAHLFMPAAYCEFNKDHTFSAQSPQRSIFFHPIIHVFEIKQQKNWENKTLLHLTVCINITWAASWRNQWNDLCIQWRHISAWAQSDQSSLSAWRNIGSSATHSVNCED